MSFLLGVIFGVSASVAVALLAFMVILSGEVGRDDVDRVAPARARDARRARR